MKYAIAKGGFLVTSPSENCREPMVGERKVKCVYASQSMNPILKRETGYSLLDVSHTKATFQMSHADTDLGEAKQATLQLLDVECKRIRDSGFVSSVTGEWTGKTTKDNIIRAMPVSQSSRNAKGGGRGNNTRKFKTSTGQFLDLTNNQITDIDDEINGDTGFIQTCYDREAAITSSVDGVLTNATNVNTLYQTEIGIGWPQYGELLP